MSHSPLARQPRKSLSAFSRAPSQLARSTTTREDLLESPSPASGSGSGSSSSSDRKSPTHAHAETNPAFQNAFASPSYNTPTRKPRFRHSTIGIGSSTPRTPLTPTRIVYSPYATPPAPLSKSSAIPFDMAANQRAAAKAEQERRARASLGGAVETAKEKKKRFVRQKPLWKRVIEWPGSVIDSAIIAVPTSVEEMLPPARFANPIALFFYVLQWLLLAPLRAPPDDTAVIRQGTFRSSVDGRWERYEEGTRAANRRGIVGSRTAISITFILLALSTANAVWLFTRHRTYDLLLRSARDTVPSPNASPIPAPKMTSTSTSTDDETSAAAKASPTAPALEKYARLTGHLLWMLIKWAARSTLSAFGARPPASSAGFRSDDRIQCLRVWDPPEFCLAFFCAFAPSAPIISYFLTNSKPFITPMLHAVTAFLLSHLAASFSQLVKDRQILSAEVMREYDSRFVYKRLFATMVDRGVGTSDP